jgi:glycopeptide antibiotics resistance protein
LWIPKNASVFFDLHDDWKNAAGFGALALLMYLGWPLDRHGEQSTLRVTRAFQIAFCCLTVVFMELLQLLIPSRHCDWKDMIWGSLGVCLALIPALVLRRFLHAAGGAL